MKKRIFTGAAPALITPFNEDGSVNFNEFQRLIEDQINGGSDALVVCATTGESVALDYDTRSKLIEVAVKTVNGRVPVIVGSGTNDTERATKISQSAEKLGADGLLMVTPYYNKTSQDGLVAHYKYIADRVDTPIILYNVPSRTGVNIKPETYARLAEHKNIVAVKEANGDISSVISTKYYCGDALDIYSGNDDQILPILSVGGIGVISVVSNVSPKIPHDICKLYFEGKTKEAADLQVSISRLVAALFNEVNPIPVKAAMNMIGYKAGNVKLPLIEASDSTKKMLISAMKELNIL